MIYFKSLGLDTSRFRTATLVVKEPTPTTSITDEMSRVRAEEEAFIASLPRCTMARRMPDGTLKQVSGYQYTQRNGLKTCVVDPIAARKSDLGLGVQVTSSAMPLFGSSREVPGIRVGYLNTLLKAQGSPEGKIQAQNLGVSWDQTKFDIKFSDWAKSKIPSVPLFTDEILPGRLAIANDLRAGGWTPEEIELAKNNPDKEKLLRASLAISAHNYAAIKVPANRKRRAEGEGVRTHFPQACINLGLPEYQLPCCAEAITRGGFGIESYIKALSKQDPAVMSCLNAAQSAVNRRKLFMAAGAMGVVVVGAALWKKRKKGRKR